MKKYGFRDEDIQELLRLINIATRCWVGKDILKPILTEMVKIFQAKDALYFSFDQESRSIDLKDSFCLYGNNSYIGYYLDYYRQYDPLYSFEFRSQPLLPVFKTDDIIPYSQLIKLDYYHDFLRPQSIYSELIIRLCSDDRFYGVIELFRSHDQPNYQDSDLLKAMILAVCLTNTFHNIDLLAKINQDQKMLEHWIDCQQAGVILADYKLEYIYCNRMAKELCVSLQNGNKSTDYSIKTCVDGFPIPSEVLQGCMELKKMSENKDYSTPIQYQRVFVTENKRIYMNCYLAHPFCSSLAPFFVINLHNLPYVTHADTAIGNNFSLTKREYDIVLCISEGLTNSEIADRLFISERTVATHIRNILEKTDLKNRVQILNLLKPSFNIRDLNLKLV